MFFLAVLLCCWIRSCNIRQSRASPGKLLYLLRSSSGRSPDPLPETRVVSGRAEPARKTVPSKPLSPPYPDATRWIRTPSSWTSVPEAYAPDDRQFPRLPYSEFPPVLYHGSHFKLPSVQFGFTGCGQDSILYLSRPLSRLWQRGGHLFLHQIGIIPKVTRSLPCPPLLNPLSQLSVAGPRGCSPAKPPVPRLLAHGGTPCRPMLSTQASLPSRKSSSTSKPQGQESMPTTPFKNLEKKIIPSAFIKDFYKSVSSRPGRVLGLRVLFKYRSVFSFKVYVCAFCFIY